MTPRARTQVWLAVITTSLMLASCGTRLDHATIVQAAQGTGTAGELSGTAPDEPGALDGPVPGTQDDATAAPGDVAGTGDGTGRPGSGSKSGTPGTGGADGTGTPGSTGGTGTGGSGRNGQEIVIGSVGTYSGAVGTVMGQGPRALQAWAASVNARGGISGHRIKVIVMDDGGDASRARSQVQELAEKHQVVAFVANMALTASKDAWKGYVESKKVPVIGGPCGFWNDSPMLFNQCPDMPSFAYGPVFLAGKYGKGDKFGALACTEDSSCPYIANRWFEQGDAKRAGLNPVYRATISFTQPDFTSECIGARNAGVEVLAVLADSRTIERVAASCHRQNYQPQFVAPAHTFSEDAPAKTGLADAIGAAMTFPFAGLNTPAFREFDTTWKKYAREPARGPASLGWAAAKIFEKALTGAGEKVSRESIAKQLYSFRKDRFGGSTVPLTFGPNGTAESHCIFLMKGSGGRWTAPNGDKPLCW